VKMEKVPGTRMRGNESKKMRGRGKKVDHDGRKEKYHHLEGQKKIRPIPKRALDSNKAPWKREGGKTRKNWEDIF